MLALALAWQCCYLASLPWYPRTQPCSSGSALAGSVACDSSSDLEARLDSLVAQINNLTTVSQRARLLQNAAGAVEDAMIAPYPWWNEALHGFAGEGALAAASISGASCYREHEFGPRTCATSFPAHITTAGAFNRTLVRAIGTAIGVEARAFSNLGKSGLTFWTPNLNIFRDPRWGRGQETPGEDPVLNADWAEDFVGGFQDPGFDGPGKMKASACCKHFAAYSLEQYNASIDRHSFNAVVSEQDLVDTYYPAFVSCANRGNASGLMCSYNSVNGVPSCANKNLLTNLAREKWGFNGYITSDCGAVSNVARAHHFSPVNDTCRVVLDAGMDSDCGTFGDLNFFEEHLVAAMQDGTVGSGMWERAARNLFRVQMRLGMFDPDSELPYRQWGVEKIDTSEHRLLALEAARQGIVLAVNHNRTLPIGRDLRVAVVGPNADAKATLLSNYHGTPPFSPTSVLDGLTMLSPDYNASLLYAKGCTISSLSSSGIAEAVSTVEEADVSIVVIGLDDSQEREGKDRTSIKLPGVQETLVLAAANASSSPIVVVVISGGPVDLSLVVQHPNVGAIVIAGYPGQSGGLAVAEVVFGAINPSGRLSQTWYNDTFVHQCSMLDYNMRPNATTGCPGRTYRFYTGTPVFEFGTGLSYSSFEVLAIEQTPVKCIDGTELEHTVAAALYQPHEAQYVLNLSVAVRNVGPRSGAVSILGFVQAPMSGCEGLPIKALKRYGRTADIPASGNATIEMLFTAFDFAVPTVEGSLQIKRGNWSIIVDTGAHATTVGMCIA